MTWPTLIQHGCFHRKKSWTVWVAGFQIVRNYGSSRRCTDPWCAGKSHRFNANTSKILGSQGLIELYQTASLPTFFKVIPCKRPRCIQYLDQCFYFCICYFEGKNRKLKWIVSHACESPGPIIAPFWGWNWKCNSPVECVGWQNYLVRREHRTPWPVLFYHSKCGLFPVRFTLQTNMAMEMAGFPVRFT